MVLDELRDKVHEAISELLVHDGELLVNDANERTITHRFALWLQAQFPEWKVDCEYNRHYDRTKRLKGIGRKIKRIDDTNGTSVFPDVIIHHRMTDRNLLVIEVKKSSNPEPNDFDLEKLAAFKNELGYENGLFLRFVTGVKEPAVAEEIWT